MANKSRKPSSKSIVLNIYYDVNNSMSHTIRWYQISEKTKKTIGITICLIDLLILLSSFFFNPLVFIIVVSLSILFISGIFPILYYVKLMKQQITPEDYYLKIVEKNYSHLDEPLLIKMFEIRINSQRNFLFAYLTLLAAFTFATLSNKDYFKTMTIGVLNLYYWYIVLGIIGILVLTYAIFGFDRFTLKELEILIKAKEKLKHLKEKNISQLITQKE